MGNGEHYGPWYLMVRLDGKAHRVVEPGAVVAGIYDVVEVVPASQLRGAVDARDALQAAIAEAVATLSRGPEANGVKALEILRAAVGGQ